MQVAVTTFLGGIRRTSGVSENCPRAKIAETYHSAGCRLQAPSNLVNVKTLRRLLKNFKVCFASTFYLKLVAVIEFIALLSSTGAGCYTRSQADKPPQYHKAHKESTDEFSLSWWGSVVESVDV